MSQFADWKSSLCSCHVAFVILNSKNTERDTWNTKGEELLTWQETKGNGHNINTAGKIEINGNTAGTNRHNETGEVNWVHWTRDCQNNTGSTPRRRLKHTAGHWETHGNKKKRETWEQFRDKTRRERDGNKRCCRKLNNLKINLNH